MQATDRGSISDEEFYAFPVQIFGLIHSGEGLLILNTVILSSKSDLLATDGRR
jgi:hypothetical protein